MKIQEIKIHNIASIEDATVDFRKEPLAGSDVFLITGKTGSGKTTILDAISLALFNTTPRLIHAEKEKVENNRDNLRLDDPRQLMRRETADAYVELSFEGIDRKNYEAKWAVQRGTKGKTSTSIGKVTWSIKCVSDGTTLACMAKNPYDEVENAIAKVIGLDFKQFCRTTMLAQGEFTRFLKSKEDEKSDILAKITQFTQYSRIGQKIYEIENRKKGARDEAVKATEDKGLNEDELDALKKEIEGLETELKEAGRKKDEDVLKKEWLELSGELDGKKAEIREQQKVLDGEDFRKEEKDVTDWDASIDVRNSLVQRRAEEDAITQEQRTLEMYREEHARLLGMIDFLKKRIEENKEKERITNVFLESERERKDVYAVSGQVCDALKRISNNREEIAQCERTAAELKKQIEQDLEPNLKIAEGNLDNARKAVSTLESMEAVQSAQADLTGYENAVIARREEEEAIKKAKKELALAELELGNLIERIVPQQQLAERLKKTADKLKDTVDDWAKAMRSKLSCGEIDICPVCGQKVLDTAFSEDSLNDLYKSANDEYKKANEEFEEMVINKNKIVTELEIKRDGLEKRTKKFANDTSVSDAFEKAEASCSEFGLSASDDNTSEALSTMLAGKLAELRSYGYSAGANKKIKVTRNHIQEDIRLILEPQAKGASEQLSDAEKKEGQEEAKTVPLTRSMEDDIKYVKKHIIGEDWMEAPGTYADNVLKPAADKYYEALRELGELQSDGAQKEMSDLCDIMKNITNIIPDWKEDEGGKSKPVEDAFNMATRLFGNVQSSFNALQAAAQRRDDAQKIINKFLQYHDGFTVERLEHLSGDKGIEGKKKKVEDERQKMQILLREEENLNKDLEKLQAPVLTEEDTLENISKRIENFEKVILRDGNQTLGVKKNALKGDEKKKEGIAALEEAATAAAEDYEEWCCISKELGDKEGRKFRLIAQSFILDNLLHSANIYLQDRKLAPRYKLKAVPNTLHISVEDAYQGYSTRSTDSLSGGESFLVSLALALALSDIGEGLAVDTLFIDEGFGTLSGEPLTRAINVLRGLHSSSGRHIGIISHVEEVKENIPVQIQVNQEGGSSSSTIKVTVDG